jgi:hypothetical protein
MTSPSSQPETDTSCGVLNCFALGLQLVNMMFNPQSVFRALSYAAHNALLVWLHVLRNLAIRAAVRISDKSLSCLRRFGALSAARAA